MPKLPKKIGTMYAVDAEEYGGNPRPYLGMSSIGKACWRQLWYSFHWAVMSKHKGRTQRIFDIGHLFEEMAISDLKKQGCFVYRVDKDGKQIELTGNKDEEQEEIVGFAGHAKGHPDGRIYGLAEYPKKNLLLELKTMNNENFLKFRKLKVQFSHPVYYDQTQKYMLELGLEVAFFLAINKDNCAYWWEFVHLDRGHAEELRRKERVIIMSDEPPERAFGPGDYGCNFCDKYDVCHLNGEPEENCRTCEYSDIEDGGKWSCTNPIDPRDLSTEDQRKGCSHWEKGWGL